MIKRTKDKSLDKPRSGEKLVVEWGETPYENTLERLIRSDSLRQSCKGPHCETAFDKLY